MTEAVVKARPSECGYSVCVVTGQQIPYRGYGRPAKYAPGVAHELKRERARKYMNAKNAAKREARKSLAAAVGAMNEATARDRAA